MQTQNRLITLLFFLPPSIVLAIHSYIGFFSRFMADDFCSINDAQRFKMLRYIWHWYNNWGGRYSAIASDELLVYIGPVGIRYMPIVVVLIWITTLSISCYILLQKGPSRKVSVAFTSSLGILALYALITVSPNVQTVLYWWNGMRTYIPPLIFGTAYLAYIYWAANQPNAQKHVYRTTFFSFSMALFIGGFNETFTAIQFLFFTGITGFLLVTKKLRFTDIQLKLLSAAIAGSVVALTIMALSPGAARRQTFFPPRPDLLTMINIAVSGYLNYLYGIAGSLKKISAIAGMAFAFIWFGINSEKRHVSPSEILLTILGGFALSFASLVPSVYGLGQLPAARTFIIPTYILIISLASSGLFLGNWLSNKEGLVTSNRFRNGMLLCTVGLILSSAWINTKDIYENRAKYIEYAQLWDDVDANIKNAKLSGEESVIIPAMSGWANLDRPNENPNFWATACYTEFYSIQIYGPPYDQ